MKSILNVQDLGRSDYLSTLELQKRLVDEVKLSRDGLKTSTDDIAHLLLVEHDPAVVTLGRRGRDKDFRISREKFAELGIEIHETSRGGEVTFHGPGQLVGYPIIRIDRRGRDVRGYVSKLEEVIIRLLGKFDIDSSRREGFTGVWVGDVSAGPNEKIAAIGVAVHRWTTYHGFALNVCTDLSNFDLFVPCGITDKPVTSMSRVLGRDISVEQVKPPLIETFAEVFGFDVF